MNRAQMRDAIRQFQKNKHVKVYHSKDWDGEGVDKGAILVPLSFTLPPPDKSEAKIKRKVKRQTQKRNR